MGSLGGSRKVLDLPDFPRARVVGKCVVLIDEDGRESFWGEEETAERAREVADEIQLEMRAIRYVRVKLMRALDSIAEEISELSVSRESLDKIIYEGCFGLQRLLFELSDTVVL